CNPGAASTRFRPFSQYHSSDHCCKLRALEGTRMDRRNFLQMSALAATALPIQGAFAMQTASQQTRGAATIISPKGAQAYSMMGGGEARLLVTGEKTKGAWWMGRFREDPGFTTQLHYHPKADEQFYVLEGVLSVYVVDAWHELGPGTLGLLPHGTPHAQANHSDKPVHFLGSGAPAGFEKFFPAV